MQDNFDIKQYLIENQMTRNSRLLNEMPKENPHHESHLVRFSMAIQNAKTVEEARNIFKQALDYSTVNDKNKKQMLYQIEQIKSLPALIRYMYNSILKFEKMGVREAYEIYDDEDNVVSSLPDEIELDEQESSLEDELMDQLDETETEEYESSEEELDEMDFDSLEEEINAILEVDEDLYNMDEFDESLDEMEDNDEEELYEAKKPSAGLTKKEKSKIVKKARAGKDIGKKGKGFEKIEKAAAKEYGSEEAGKKVAASAMWKNIKRK